MRLTRSFPSSQCGHIDYVSFPAIKNYTLFTSLSRAGDQTRLGTQAVIPSGSTTPPTPPPTTLSNLFALHPYTRSALCLFLLYIMGFFCKSHSGPSSCFSHSASCAMDSVLFPGAVYYSNSTNLSFQIHLPGEHTKVASPDKNTA